LKLRSFWDAGFVGLVLALAICLSNPLCAQMRNADPTRGYQLAQRLCATCHAIEVSSTATVNPDVPSLPAIARQPNVTAEQLAGRIIVPHPEMPNTSLTVAEMRDVIAYILSLKPTR
jgi:mono/diheme cytochrome c family protein